MKIKSLLFTSFCLFMLCHLQAQDRHFTLYNFSPLNLNPAFTGAFNGTVRVGGIFRDQLPGMEYINRPLVGGAEVNGRTNIYKTMSFYADSPILTVRKRDWVSVGVNFFRDRSGTLSWGDQYFKLAAAYHLSLNKKRTSVLTLGIQWGQVQRGFDPTLARLADPNENLAGFATGTNGLAQTSFQDYAGGLMLRTEMNKTTKLEIGLAADHVTTPGDNRQRGGGGGMTPTNNPQGQGPNFIVNATGTVGGPNPQPPTTSTIRRVPLNMLWTAHGKLDRQINKRLSIAPSFMVQLQAATPPEIVLQVPVGFTFNEEKNQKFNVGLGYRVGDAAQVLLGYDVNDFRFAASYDITLSGLNQVNQTVGGFEIAAMYIIKIYKEPKVEPAIICPRF